MVARERARSVAGESCIVGTSGMFCNEEKTGCFEIVHNPEVFHCAVELPFTDNETISNQAHVRTRKQSFLIKPAVLR